MEEKNWYDGVPAPFDADGNVVPLTTRKLYRGDGREVAEELRALDVSDLGDAGNVIDTIEESGALFARILHVANDYRPGLQYATSHFVARDAVELFADLIDRPTCQNKQVVFNRTSPKEFRTDNFICSACGEIFCADGDGVNHPIDWAFCPNCGAEVLND